MSYGTTTPRDLQAAAWLLEQGAEIDTIRSFLAPPLNIEQQQLLDLLLANSDSRLIEGQAIIVSSVEIDHYVSEISSVAHRLRDLLEPSALVVLVKMPSSLQLVARSADDSVDVGEITRLLGGGGHSRAAAANIHDKSLEESIAGLWDVLSREVRSVTRVADLM